MAKDYDFSGWATRNNIRCSDGRTIKQDAFKDNDGKTVPLVYGHNHTEINKVLGHALLENRPEGVYAYCSLNDTDNGKDARELVKHGDIVALSIYANQLRESGGNVMHGNIRELSLVLAGANPGAYIDTIIAHSEDMDEHAEMSFIGFGDIEVAHADEPKEPPKEEKKEEKKDMADKEKTVQDVINSMTEEQRSVMEYVVGMALQESKGGKEEGGEDVKHNLFDSEMDQQDNVISHDAMVEIIDDAKRFGSLKESALQHGITDIDILFPEAQSLNKEPEFIKREQDWVSKVMGGTHHTPFARIKSVFANITEDEARAKGFLPDRGEKGTGYRDAYGRLVDAEGNHVMKKEEVFSLLKRKTEPATIYKKQGFDRDDIIDITDFDVVSWVKGEMRMMLNEEIARAILVGDGRSDASDDKINESNIRPIWKDADLYTVKVGVPVTAASTEDQKAKAAIRAIIKSRKKYKGSGDPKAYITEDLLTDMLLLEDVNGRVIYDTIEKLKTALRVSEIVTVPVMENLTRTNSFNGKNYKYTLGCIIVNLADYNVGADKGGSVTMFDDFDIDYNTYKYLIETRISGALTKPFSAMAVEFVEEVE